MAAGPVVRFDFERRRLSRSSGRRQMTPLLITLGVVIVAIRIWRHRYRAARSGRPTNGPTSPGAWRAVAATWSSSPGARCTPASRPRVQSRHDHRAARSRRGRRHPRPQEKQHRGRARPAVGIVGRSTLLSRQTLVAVGKARDVPICCRDEDSFGAAKAALRAGRIDLALVDDRYFEVDQRFSASDSSTLATYTESAAHFLGVEAALRSEGVPNRTSARSPSRSRGPRDCGSGA